MQQLGTQRVPLRGVISFVLFIRMEEAPLCGIRTFILFIRMEAEMVLVERRSGKERRSGVERRQGYSHVYGGPKRVNNWDRRSGKDRRKSPPEKT